MQNKNKIIRPDIYSTSSVWLPSYIDHKALKIPHTVLLEEFVFLVGLSHGNHHILTKIVQQFHVLVMLAAHNFLHLYPDEVVWVMDPGIEDQLLKLNLKHLINDLNKSLNEIT